MLGLWSADVGIDLGTANTLIHVRGRGIVLNEPSVVAVSKRTGQVLSVGTEARRMLGRTPADIVAMRPLRNGVIADYEHTEQMIRHFIARALNRAWHVSHPRVVVGVPSGVTEVEKRAVTDAATTAGAREAHLIEEPMAAAIGAGLPIQSAAGSMIVDIGGGTTEVAVMSLGGVVAATSARVGGDEMDEAIVQYVRRNMGLLIGERTAEDIKIVMGSAFPMPEERSFVVRGRDLVTGLPKTVEMTTAHVRDALSGVLVDIVRAVKTTLDATPPELVDDIVERGIVVSTGPFLLPADLGLTLRGEEIPAHPASLAEVERLHIAAVLKNTGGNVTQAARILDIEIHDDAVSEIARRARGTPRFANRLLRRVRDYAQVRGDGRATVDTTRTALGMLEIDELGLEPLDRQLLETLILKFKGGPVGLDTIATSLSEEPETIEDVHEPYLIQIGFLARTSRGRVATELAYRHLGLVPPDPGPQQTRLL